MNLEHRTYALTIGRSGELGRTWDGLRVAFSFERTTSGLPNRGTVKVWNLNEESRAFVQAKGLRLLFAAGYNGQNVLLFSGDVDRVVHTWDGRDWLTSIEGGDGQSALGSAYVSKAFQGPVSMTQAIGELVDAMGLGRANITGVPSTTTKSGMVLHGPAPRELDRLCREAGLVWSVQSGVVQVYPKGSHNGEPVVVLDKDSGLIGAPEKISAKTGAAQSEVGGVKLRSLLMGQIVPGGRVQIASRLITGVYRVQKVTHTGDSRGAEWFTDLEARV